MPDFIFLDQIEWILLLPLSSIFGFLLYGWYENVTRTDKTDRQSRLPLYNKTIIMLWGLAAVCIVCWGFSGRTMETLGFRWAEPGWRAWLAWSFVALSFGYFVYSTIMLVFSVSARQQVRTQLNGADLDFMRPRTLSEHRRFKLLSVTAGITEEIIFRGFLIALLSLFMPTIFAVIGAVILFGVGHIYQGFSGIVQTSLIGSVLAIIYIIGGSLWPAILVHILIDLTAAAQFQLIDRFKAQDNAIRTSTLST